MTLDDDDNQRTLMSYYTYSDELCAAEPTPTVPRVLLTIIIVVIAFANFAYVTGVFIIVYNIIYTE